MKNPPFSWIRKMKETVPEAFEIPLFGNAPHFDWHHFSTLFAKELEMSELSFRPLKQEWLSKEQLANIATPQSSLFSVLCRPLNAFFYFLLPKTDRNKLAAWMMQSKTKGQISEALKEGFCRFLALQALSIAQTIDPLSELSFSLSEKGELPEEEAFCIEVECSLGTISSFGNFILPKTFRNAWISHFSNFASPLPKEMAKKVQCVVGLECGSLFLSQAEWEKIEPGDFLLLDQATISPKEKVGTLFINLGTTALFQAKVAKNQIEIIDYAASKERMEQEPNQEAAIEEENTSIKNIPMHLTVELARLKIPLDRLLHLQPGNTLELPVHPEEGVTLTVNGEKVGKAELLYLGEALGIRILEIGK